MPNPKEGALLALAAVLTGDPTTKGLRERFLDTVTQDPMESILMTVLVGSFLFFQAEKDENPKVKTMSDALVFVSTSLSVGYSDIFPKTDKGKLIATALQTFGPALSARALDGPKEAAEIAATAAAADTQKEILSKLDAILVELKAQRLSA